MDGVERLADLFSSANVVSLTFVFVFGTLFGSFVNVCIGRMPVGKSIVWPGSACTSCGVPLPWWQNIPIVSYLALGARCYYCSSPFSIRYFLMEVLTGLIGVAVFASTHTEAFVRYYGVGAASYAFVYYFTFSCLLVIVFFVDLDAWIILDEINYFGIAVGIIGSWYMPPQFVLLQYLGYDVGPRLMEPYGGGANVAWAAGGAAVGFAMFLSIALLGSLLARQEAMGRGDVKFAALIGAFLGPQKGFLALILSFPLGALFAIPLILVRGKSGKTPIPFGTFMAVAAFAVAVAGESLLRFVPFPYL